jgi:hypothetical protein
MRPSLSVLTLVVTGLVVSLYGIPLAVMFIVSPISSLQSDPFAPLFILVSAVGLGILWLALRVARRHREPRRRLLALPLVVSWPGDSGKSGAGGRRAGEHPLVRFAHFVCRQGNTPPGEPPARRASLSELLAADAPDGAHGADG